MSLHPHPAAQREDGRQVRAGLSASQVPSQAPRFIFLSSPPTAFSFPPVPSPLRLPGLPQHRPAGNQPGQRLQAHLTGGKTEVRGEDVTCPEGSAPAAYWSLATSLSPIPYLTSQDSLEYQWISTYQLGHEHTSYPSTP